jgi:hypothetical protein
MEGLGCGPDGLTNVRRERKLGQNMSRDLVISIEETLLAEATSKAASEHRTIDELMHQWLAEYVHRKNRIEQHRELMERLSYVHAPERRLTRDELNER